MELALVTARLVQFAAAMLLFGTLAFRLYVGGAPETRAPFDRWVRRLVLPAAAVALVSALCWLDVEAVIMGDGWANAVDGATLATVLFDTEFGQAWIWHLILAAALLGLLIPARASRARGIILAGLAAALVASLAWAGHAVMATGGAGFARLTTQVVHLLAGALWLGGLPPLGFILAQARSDRGGAWVDLARQALPRFSLAGSLAVGLLFITGCLNSWFLVGHPRALVDTPYGLVLLAKIGLFLVLVAVACRNRFGLMPKLQQTAAAGGPLTHLARNVAFEQGIGLLILAVVSVLGTLAPARLG